MKFHNAMANYQFGAGALCRATKKCQCERRRRKKDTSALQMSHWEHIGYIYQSRKHYRVNKISIWHLLHIQKLDPQIFSSQGHVVIIEKIKASVYTAVTLCIYSRMTWPERMHHHTQPPFHCSRLEARALEVLPKSYVTSENLLNISGLQFSDLRN